VLAHVRLTVPSDLSATVRDILLSDAYATNVTHYPGAVLEPEGDLLEADVAREQVGALLQRLQRLGVGRRGGIVVLNPTSTFFDAAARLEAVAPGHPEDAVIWDAVEAEAEDGAVPTVSFLLFLVFAVVLAAIAVITDSAVLVVGAMVVGPEFSAIAGISAGLVLRRWGLAVRSLRLLVLSFAFAVSVVAVLALVARLAGLVETEMVTRPRPNTDFIWHPDVWAFLVAIVAGAAGALALAVQRTAAMVGVFISVTTVPAAGNLALGLAVWAPREITGSLAQLGANTFGMVVSGTLVLTVVRVAWPAITRRTERLLGG